ncbi:histidine--tRNA ligase, cytoplasmic-like [Rhodamnia argentea]|uniref:Histidine--tRNA ligase, cytoplasmic n=1 Tax=Rhodamnia argentea TaxID=178133 RepID=A0A8B8MRU2_9MYRT|nr:histidine--tRNA ligase, cytoplasmic-like [Rhodamnia argentea]
MADASGTLKTVTLGAKSSSLSASSVHAVSAGTARICVDSSARDRLASSPPDGRSFSASFQISFPRYFTIEETRASLTVLLNKLLLSGRSGTGTVVVDLISDFLNSVPPLGCPDFGNVAVSHEELCILDNSQASLYGICAVLYHQSTALSTIIDPVAALSCEAISEAAFDRMGSESDPADWLTSSDSSDWLTSSDSSDWLTSKEEIEVARVMRLLLNGSTLAGKAQCEAFWCIPIVHATLREVVKSVQSEVLVNLNSSVIIQKVGSSADGAAKALGNKLLELVNVLLSIGKSSLCRAKMNLDSIAADALKSSLTLIFEKECVSMEDLDNEFKVLMDAFICRDYEMIVHELYMLCGCVWKIVVWEVITAFVALEGSVLCEKGKLEEITGVRADKTSEKKVVLGKGTTVVMQLLKDRIQRNGETDGDSPTLLEKLVKSLLLFLDMKGPEFDHFWNKVKDIVNTNGSSRLPKLPKGTRDFANEEMVIRNKVFSIVTSVFKKHGAAALDSPAFELRETMMGKYGMDSRLICDLADQGGELCSLQYNLTIPFARYMAMNGLTSLKKYQIARVYRWDNPCSGRFHEVFQCDFDIAGQHVRMGPDFEVIHVLTELLDKLSIGDYEVKLNHQKLLEGMLEICGVPLEKFRTICSSIDKLDKQSFEQIGKEMMEENGLTAAMVEGIGNFVKEGGSPLELLSKLQEKGSKFLENEGSMHALNDLEILFKALEKSKCIDKVVFDLSLARDLDYYTGVIFEAVFKGATQVGSIATGGRYDNLIGMFGTKQVPVVGFSLEIERVFAMMEQLLKDQNQIIRDTETQVLVGFLVDDLPLAAELVSEVWNAGLKAEFMVDKELMKHIDYAKNSQIPWMVLVGEQELSEGVVKLKDVENEKEELVPRSTIVEELINRTGEL